MIYKTEEITEMVRVLLDHAKESGTLFALDDADALGIETIIRSKIEPGTRIVLTLAPAEQIDTAVPLHGSLSWRGEPGIGMGLLRLPDDYLRLLSVKLSDWQRPARIISETDPEYAWQSSRYLGVKGNPDRPVAALVRYPEGLCVECYSSIGGEEVTLERGLYVREPEIVGDCIDLPFRLVGSIIRMIASMACLTLGDATTASLMERRAMEMLSPGASAATPATAAQPQEEMVEQE